MYEHPAQSARNEESEAVSYWSHEGGLSPLFEQARPELRDAKSDLKKELGYSIRELE